MDIAMGIGNAYDQGLVIVRSIANARYVRHWSLLQLRFYNIDAPSFAV